MNEKRRARSKRGLTGRSFLCVQVLGFYSVDPIESYAGALVVVDRSVEGREEIQLLSPSSHSQRSQETICSLKYTTPCIMSTAVHCSGNEVHVVSSSFLSSSFPASSRCPLGSTYASLCRLGSVDTQHKMRSREIRNRFDILLC